MHLPHSVNLRCNNASILAESIARNLTAQASLVDVPSRRYSACSMPEWASRHRARSQSHQAGVLRAHDLLPHAFDAREKIGKLCRRMHLSGAPAGRGMSVTRLLGGWASLLALLVAMCWHSAEAGRVRQLLVAPTDAKPNFVLPSLDGSSHDYGRVVLVHFFAAWCEPCRDELA